MQLQPAEASSSPVNVGKFDNNVDQSIASSTTAYDHNMFCLIFAPSRLSEMQKLGRAWRRSISGQLLKFQENVQAWVFYFNTSPGGKLGVIDGADSSIGQMHFLSSHQPTACQRTEWQIGATIIRAVVQSLSNSN